MFVALGIYVVTGAGGAVGLTFTLVINSTNTTCTNVPTIGNMRGMRRSRAYANVIGSTANRAIVNTSVLVGKADGKAIASVSNGFSLGNIGGKAVLHVSCMKFRAGRIACGNGPLRVALGSSSGTLRRIMMATLNVGGSTGGLNCTIDSVGTRSLGEANNTGLTTNLCNGTSNIHVRSTPNNNASTMSVSIHNLSSVGNGARPLLVLSNIPVRGNGAGGGSC